MSDFDAQLEIGGYFGLDIPDYGELYPSAVKLNSGRSAMRAALQAGAFKSVYIPDYICTSIITAAKNAGLEVKTYTLTENLLPFLNEQELEEDTAIIYVNYFGLCDQQVDNVLERYPVNQVLIDNSQALFCLPKGEFASIYSPRKFVGLPDGGLILPGPNCNIDLLLEEDQGSLQRMDYLLVRLAYSARAGYEGFNRARLSLTDDMPLQMSKLTQRLLKSIPWQTIKHARQDNFATMHDYFATRNAFPIRSGIVAAPLCYPLQLECGNMSQLKQALADVNIFTATYWPDAAERAQSNKLATDLIYNTLFLPIDQRLSHVDILTICCKIDELLIQFGHNL